MYVFNVKYLAFYAGAPPPSFAAPAGFMGTAEGAPPSGAVPPPPPPAQPPPVGSLLGAAPGGFRARPPVEPDINAAWQFNPAQSVPAEFARFSARAAAPQQGGGSGGGGGAGALGGPEPPTATPVASIFGAPSSAAAPTLGNVSLGSPTRPPAPALGSAGAASPTATA